LVVERDKRLRKLLREVMKFIDLYAGLGGFHLALEGLGHECVFASEINPNLRELYQKNFPGVLIRGDILKTDIKVDIPDHHILCGGFPCQPFSRAGLQLGFNDEKKGNHFFRIMEILNFHKPEYLLLENVETILRHDNCNTFNVIRDNLGQEYDIDFRVLSPHEFNIPHHRRRLFIVGRRLELGGLRQFEWPRKKDIDKTSLYSLRFKFNPAEKLGLSIKQQKAFDIWNDFVKKFPEQDALPGFPIWSHEWGATYDFENRTPFSTPVNELVEMRGSFGKKIVLKSKDEILKLDLPRYASYEEDKFPGWKITYIRRNREFYKKYKKYLDVFKSQLVGMEFSNQKFEWCCGNDNNTLEDKVIQFRQSGVRVSKSNWAPALTTVKTQNIFLPWLNRTMSSEEKAQLQSMQKLKYLPDPENGAHKAFGNAVNVKLVQLIAKNLLNAK
jgi:DNA (cytosine-5)-methyltransferase 1